jgi:flagellar basal-body rod protein FlgF
VIRGLYSSADGLLVQSTRTDVIAGNLAGVSVSGYRRDVPVTAFTRMLWRTAGMGAAGVPGSGLLLRASAHTDLSPGALRHTGGTFDLALDGEGYFCVQTAGREAYTRGGAFRLDAFGRLVTAAGDPVLGQTGPVRITGGKVEFLENGDVVVDGVRVDRLKLVNLSPDAPIRKLGRGLLQASPAYTLAPNAEPPGRIRQGYLEEANVNAVSELAAMIASLRAFEASQRALQASDQTLEKAINEIARV